MTDKMSSIGVRKKVEEYKLVEKETEKMKETETMSSKK
jgi:hypothetical protein